MMLPLLDNPSLLTSRSSAELLACAIIDQINIEDGASLDKPRAYRGGHVQTESSAQSSCQGDTSYHDHDNGEACLQRKCVEQIPDNLLQLIFDHLDSKDLVQCMGVSSRFRYVATKAAQHRFKQTWGVGEVVGRPAPPTFYLACKAHHFSWNHKLERYDTCASLALKYRTSVQALKRHNNMISDASLASRVVLLIPGVTKTDLSSKSVAYHWDTHAQRHHFTIHTTQNNDILHHVLKKNEHEQSMAPTKPHEQHEQQQQQQQQGKESDSTHSGIAPPPPPQHVQGLTSQSTTAKRPTAQSRRTCQILSSNLQVDEATCAYYLDIADGDVREAIALFKEDRQWDEEQQRLQQTLQPQQQRQGPTGRGGDVASSQQAGVNLNSRFRQLEQQALLASCYSLFRS